MPDRPPRRAQSLALYGNRMNLSLSSWYRAVRPILWRLEPERAHRLTIWMLAHRLTPRLGGVDDPILASRVLGLDFPNPLGLAAGFDKDAEAVSAILGLGFGFVEVGTITPRPQPGNPKPRVFRLVEDAALINRLGFNSAGLETAIAGLRQARAASPGALVGVNLGRNRDTTDPAADYVAGIRAVAPFADYITINVSSPNTPGLRALQDRPRLDALLARLRAALADVKGGHRPPLLLKIAPDLHVADQGDIAEVALGNGLDGLIISNTTVARPDDLRGRDRRQAGGLSGRPLFAPSTRILANLYRLTGGKVPIIGVGGISNGADAYAKIRAGASLVQLYTALVFEGPGLVRRLLDDLAARLHADGFASVADAVGADHP